MQEVYSRMSEEELSKVAADAVSLTPTALETLREEIARRGIDISVNLTPRGIDVAEFQELVTIRKFRDLPEAVMAKGLIESAGIECFLADDNLVRMDWFISNLIGGVKLQVKLEDVHAANEILQQPIPKNFEVEGIGEYPQPRCPACDSLDIVFQELNKPIAYGSAWVGMPIPVHDKGWQCKACGHRWDDAPADEEEQRLM